jgi:hypothetical protein
MKRVFIASGVWFTGSHVVESVGGTCIDTGAVRMKLIGWHLEKTLDEILALMTKDHRLWGAPGV